MKMYDSFTFILFLSKLFLLVKSHGAWTTPLTLWTWKWTFK